MALTQIRKEQIKDGSITDAKVAATAAIAYSKLDLSASIISSDLNSDGSVELQALDSKLIGLWDMVKGTASGTGSSLVVTAEVGAAAAVDTVGNSSTKGILLTGSGAQGAGVENYRVQIRDAATGDPVGDGLVGDGNGGAVYAELRESGSVYTLYFFKSDDTAHTFGSSQSIDFMFVEIFSYQTADLMSFVTGMGFADVVGVAGTHNHNDLYYTETEMNAGQMDTRYYTETELDGGQLDNRYFTETELTDGTALDGRYYTETEMNSTSGATYVGYSGDAAGATVTAGLNGLDARLDDLELSGGVTQSLDDAYDDGSIITADAGDFNVNLTDDVSFVVADSGDAVDILKVTAAAAGDSLTVVGTTSITGNSDITGTFEVTGASTLDAVTMSGNLGQSGGTVVLNATGAMDLDSSAAITVDGATIALTSTGTLEMNDSVQTTAVKLSQLNTDGFATEFAYDSQTDFDWSTRDTGTVAISSLMGAVNVNREDMYEYVELISTQGAAVGTAAGANLIGVDGISSIVPTGKTLGDDSNLQEMLEGIATTGGGSDKHFATLAAFTAAKSGGEYFNTNTQIWVEDIERQIRVLVQGSAITEGTDWDYIWGDARPMGGTSGSSKPKFHVEVTNIATDAIKLNSLGGIDIDSGAEAINIDSGAGMQLSSVGGMFFKDSYLAGFIGFSQTGVTGLVGFDTATSIVGALNENADDLATLIDTTLPAVTDGAAGADGIGATGIIGVIPTGGSVGSDGTVQTMLEGIMASAGGIKTYADEAAFVADKGTGSYLPVDTMVYLKDIDRLGIVLIENTQVVEGTDWDFLWGANQPMAGDEFNITSDAVTIDTTGSVDIDTDDGFRIDENSGSFFDMTTDGAAKLQSATGQNIDIWAVGATTEIYGNYVSIRGDIGAADAIKIKPDQGGIDIDAGTNYHVTIDTSGSGQVRLTSANEIDLNAPEINVQGNITIAADKQLNVDLINITSVDPTDNATISGQRSGTLATSNILTNSGFEAGLAADADDWTEGASASRSEVERFYNANSMHIAATDLAADEHSLTQAITGTTASTAHNVSFYARGSVGGAVTVQMNGGAAKTVDMALLDGTWRRFDVDLDADNTADGNFYLDIAGTGTEDYAFFIDAMMVQEGVMVDYFSDSMSELVFTIGSDDNDRIVMRSAGTSTTDLMVINQSTVEILGDLLVSGTTTTINSADLLVADNKIVLNDGQASGILDAFVEIDRGSDPTVALKWNETTDKWELTNDGTTYATIATTGGSGSLSMNEAYDGGSAVDVDDTNVAFTLSATKSFNVIDGTDANKFVVTEGSGADSIKIDTTGGVDIDASSTFNVTANGIDIGSTGGATSITGVANSDFTVTGADLTLSTFSSGDLKLISAANTLISAVSEIDLTGATVDINATGDFAIDGGANSTINVDDADLTLATTTSGNVVVNAATTVDIDAGTAVNVDATNISTTGILLQTGATQIIGDMNLDGSIDHDGATFNSTLSGAFEVDTTANVAISSDTGIALTDDSGNQVELNADGSLDLHAAAGQIASMATISGASFSTNATEADMTATIIDINATAGAAAIDATGNIEISSDADVIINGGDQVTIIPVSSGADAFTVSAILGGIDMDATGTFTLDAAGISIDSDAASNFSVTDANLTLSTITTGNVIISSAAELQFTDSRMSEIEFTDASNASFADGVSTSVVGAINAAYAAAAGANTLDEVYDGEAGTRLITMDNGSVEFQMTDTYEFNVADFAGVDILSVKALVGGDTVSVVGAFDVTGASTMDAITMSGNLAQSGGTVVLNATGVVDIDASSTFSVDAAGISLDSTVASNFSVVGADLTLATTTSGDIVVNAAAAFDVNAATATIDTSAAFSIDGAAASNVTVTGGDLTLSTGTSGDVVISGAANALISAVTEIDLSSAAIDINATAAFNIDGAAASAIKVTSGNLTIGTETSGELYFDDARTAAIPFSDASNAAFATGMTATSVVGAINEAFQKSSDIGYEEKIANSTDVTNDYVVLTIDLPITGTFPMTPSTLRTGATGMQYHLAVYLNGLRLADSEWNYNYSGAEKRITFNGSDDIVLVAGDKIAFELRKTA